MGRRLVPALLEHGHDVRVLVRNSSSYDAPEGIEVFEGDLLEPNSLEGVFDGIEAAYYLVHSMRAGKDFAERDRKAARNFADAASGKVERVIYLGGLGETGDELSEHLGSRREVESVLADGDYALTTLRAAVIIGAGSASFDMVCQLVEKLPVMTTPRWVRTPCQPIAIDDAVTYLVDVLDTPETWRDVRDRRSRGSELRGDDETDCARDGIRTPSYRSSCPLPLTGYLDLLGRFRDRRTEKYRTSSDTRSEKPRRRHR